MFGFSLVNTSDYQNLQGRCKNAEMRISGLWENVDTLQRRLTQALPMIANAAINLVPVFGKLEAKGTTDNDEALVFQAEDGLAFIYLYPANGRILVADPAEAVDTIEVSLADGILDRRELKRIDTFRAEVLFRRQVRTTQITGPVNLTARRSTVAHSDNGSTDSIPDTVAALKP